MSRALVLAGGGVGGIAWEVGFLLGVQEASSAAATYLLTSDLILGTSAGATVAAQIAGGASLPDLFASQIAESTSEIEPQVDMALLVDMFGADADKPPIERLRRIGALAMGANTVSAQVRREVIESRLPAQVWPDRRLATTATDATSGEVVIFERDDKVPLVDAVAASCAVPGLWPTVAINGRRYMDGGVRSTGNALLARGHDEVIVLCPSPEPGSYLMGGSLVEELANLKDSAVLLPVFADSQSESALGSNPLSPATRAPAARAGRSQGQQSAHLISTLKQLAAQQAR